MTVPHVFLTRYNLPSPGVESLIRAQEGWLRERTELFERFTVPSVRAQEGDGIHWIVFLDPESPDWLKQRMTSLQAEGLLDPVYTESVEGDDLAREVRRVVGDADAVSTSNLDNDDGLARDFVARLRQADVPAPRSALYVVNGLIRTSDRLYLRRDDDNAFVAVREPLDDGFRSCWADWHNRLHLHMPVVEIPGAPGWLQVVHSKNVSNRVRGRLVSPARYRALFGGRLSGVRNPSRIELLRENGVGAPARAVRDGVREGGRLVLVRLLGKEGVNKLKFAAAGLVRRVRGH
ncbi:glycosyltransferase [Nigerium massiliense]|uniref:glycosyltransferase n=1 Tax=Nigerium massiliense TaxID=1522317 RepID=UPI00059025DF|nr:glycosyltransferase [Nigerium massiliense]